MIIICERGCTISDKGYLRSQTPPTHNGCGKQELFSVQEEHAPGGVYPELLPTQPYQLLVQQTGRVHTKSNSEQHVRGVSCNLCPLRYVSSRASSREVRHGRTTRASTEADTDGCWQMRCGSNGDLVGNVGVCDMGPAIAEGMGSLANRKLARVRTPYG